MKERLSPGRTRAGGPSVQGWVLPHLITCAESQGCDAGAIKALPGLSNLTDPDVRVPESSAEAAWRTAVALTGDEALGVHVAESLPRGALDLVEYAFRSSASLTAGIERLTRYGRVISDRVAGRIEASGDGVVVMIADVGGSPLQPGRVEFALAIILKLARDCAGADIVPQHVSFVHGAPADVDEHQRFFRTPARFGAGVNALILSAADAGRPMQGADAALAAIIQRRLDKLLIEREVRDPASLPLRIRQIVIQQLGREGITPDRVAGELGISRRTLSRRLAADGTSFREIVDAVREEFARAMVQEAGVSIADIAFFLQYSEPAAFHRSFRRWTGQTPLEFRRAVLS